jgi:hypothetical protein
MSSANDTASHLISSPRAGRDTTAGSLRLLRLPQHHVATHGNAIMSSRARPAIPLCLCSTPVPTASSFASFLFHSRVRARLIGRVAALN